MKVLRNFEFVMDHSERKNNNSNSICTKLIINNLIIFSSITSIKQYKSELKVREFSLKLSYHFLWTIKLATIL